MCLQYFAKSATILEDIRKKEGEQRKAGQETREEMKEEVQEKVQKDKVQAQKAKKMKIEKNW